MTGFPVPLGPVALLLAAMNLPLGLLAAGAGRRSHCRYGLLAASILLLLAFRHSFALGGEAVAVLALAVLCGRLLGRHLAGDPEGAPPSLRWRFAVYAVLAGSMLLLASPPLHASTGADWKRIDAVEPAPTFTLTNQDGQRVGLKDFRGKAIVLSFIFTECKDICPVLPQIIGRTDQWLTDREKQKVRFVGISIDPKRDTPEKLRAFMQMHNLSPQRWTLLTGTLAEATRVADDYGIVAKPDLQGDLVHNAVYVLIDPRGRLRSEFHGLATPAGEIAKRLRELIGKK